MLTYFLQIPTLIIRNTFGCKKYGTITIKSQLLINCKCEKQNIVLRLILKKYNVIKCLYIYIYKYT